MYCRTAGNLPAEQTHAEAEYQLTYLPESMLVAVGASRDAVGIVFQHWDGPVVFVHEMSRARAGSIGDLYRDCQGSTPSSSSVPGSLDSAGSTLQANNSQLRLLRGGSARAGHKAPNLMRAWLCYLL